MHRSLSLSLFSSSSLLSDVLWMAPLEQWPLTPWACILLKGVHPSPGEHRGHAFHDAPEAQRPLGMRLSVPHPPHQPMKHHEHAVVVLRRWHLVKVAVRLEGQQPALLAWHSPPVVEVPFVAHDNYGSLACIQVVSCGLDGMDQPADGVEAGSVTDAVDKNVTIRPLHLLREERRLHAQILSDQRRSSL